MAASWRLRLLIEMLCFISRINWFAWRYLLNVFGLIAVEVIVQFTFILWQKCLLYSSLKSLLLSRKLFFAFSSFIYQGCKTINILLISSFWQIRDLIPGLNRKRLFISCSSFFLWFVQIFLVTIQTFFWWINSIAE